MLLTTTIGAKTVHVDTRHVLYFQCEDRYVNAHLGDGRVYPLCTKTTLTALAATLSRRFVRANRGLLVARHLITEYRIGPKRQGHDWIDVEGMCGQQTVTGAHRSTVRLCAKRVVDRRHWIASDGDACKAITDSYAAGEPIRVTAERLGVSNRTVSRIAKREGLPLRRTSGNAPTEQQVQQAKALYLAGVPWKRIEPKLGLKCHLRSLQVRVYSQVKQHSESTAGRPA